MIPACPRSSSLTAANQHLLKTKKKSSRHNRSVVDTPISASAAMADRTRYLLELVHRNVKPYIANPKTKAVMVTGSVAEGRCDEYSDCDVMLYYDELPTDGELALARQHNQ